MKKAIFIFLGTVVALVMSIGFSVPLQGQTGAVSKKPLSPEQLEMIKQKIKSGEDFIRLESDTKGSFSWWGYLTYPGQWYFYPLTCGEGNLEIHLTNIPSGSDYDLYLYDCNAVELAHSDYGGNSDELIIYWVSPNLYVIGVYCYSGGSSTQPYHLYGTYVTQPKLPDLILLSLTATDYTPIIGEQITITLTVKNQGDTLSSGFWTDLFLDEMFPPGVPSTGDYWWWTSWLDPGQTVQFDTVVTNNEIETWDMYGLTDSYGEVTEKNECNNLKGPVDVTWYGPPDLVVEEFVVSDSSPFMDEYIDVSVTIRNQGGPIDGTFRTDLYYNRSTAPPPQTPGNRYFSKNGLGAGESYDYTFYNISYQSPYLWKTWVYVDSWLNIQESNENNNIDSVSIFWREHPISDNYGWPLHPSNQQHAISGTFMEWRYGSAGGNYNQHFHDGIDIPDPADTPVYSVSAGYTQFVRDQSGNLVGIYVDKFLYYHVNIDTVKIPENRWVNRDSLIAKIQTNHLHFNDGQNQQEVNPLREDGINPFTDTINPIFYSNPITLREDDPNVGGWNGGADGQIIDKDSVYGNVDVIVHAKDEIDAGRRVGLYALSYQVCNQYCNPIDDEVLNFSFDNWYSNYYVNFIYADTFKYIITNHITSNGYWNTTELYDGTYCLKINAYDIVSFYKKFVLQDTTKLNVATYYLEDIQIKNSGNNNPVIDTGLHCLYPYEECNDCVKYGESFTLELDAYDPDGDSIYYEWFAYYGWFIVDGQYAYACTTAENYVTYEAPGFPHTWDRLQVTVRDVRGGWAFTEGWLGVYDPATNCLCGDGNDDGTVNIADAVCIVGYLYSGGPPPDPMESGDVNNDCVLNIADAMYIMNYLTAGGPLPVCGWICPPDLMTPDSGADDQISGKLRRSF
jgi:murein DD-endopeptidase MepM/ murein hydrolase activator NlpD